MLTGIAFLVDLFLNYQKWPLGDPVLRQAISIAEYGYELPAIDLPVPPQRITSNNPYIAVATTTTTTTTITSIVTSIVAPTYTVVSTAAPRWPPR